MNVTIKTAVISKAGDNKGKKYRKFFDDRSEYFEEKFYQEYYDASTEDYLKWRGHTTKQIDGITYISMLSWDSWRYDNCRRYIIGVIDEERAVMIVPKAGNYHLEITHNHPLTEGFVSLDREHQIDYIRVYTPHHPYIKFTENLTPVNPEDEIVVGFYDNDNKVIVFKAGNLYSADYNDNFKFSNTGGDYFILSESEDIAEEIGTMYHGEL